MSELNQPVCIDNGSGVMKAGFAGQDTLHASCYRLQISLSDFKTENLKKLKMSELNQPVCIDNGSGVMKRPVLQVKISHTLHSIDI